jgi:nitrite reductase/ring-hydroxylating ferredoxin subunit
MHNVCAHAGGPLAEGTLVDGCIECPWHGSRFRLTDGRARRGPTVYDQPSYEVRAAEAGGYEVRRIAS